MSRLSSFLFSLFLFSLSFSLPLSAQTHWQNPLEAGENMVHGRWWNSELKDNYHRLTPRAEGVVRSSVWGLSKQSAGLSVCFHTNAPTIRVRYKVTGGLAMFHMPQTGVSGVDLYATDADGRLRWCASKFNLSFKDIPHNRLGSNWLYIKRETYVSSISFTVKSYNKYSLSVLGNIVLPVKYCMKNFIIQFFQRLRNNTKCSSSIMAF